MTQPHYDRSGTSWLSRGFEQLARSAADESPVFDVLVVGSGYGGAIAAATLSRYGKIDGGGNIVPLDICVLERGNEYLPGAFPANSTELAGHVRFGRNRSGLFDFRPGPDVSTLVANGLGGGSLINAGVMVRPHPDTFSGRWPAALNDIAELEPYYARAEMLVGAVHEEGGGTVDTRIETDRDGNPLRKLEALRQLGQAYTTSAAKVTIAGTDRVNRAGVQLSECLRCGDCATGCNHNAKDSLDTNLLHEAHRRGVRIYSGATVLRIHRGEDDEWQLETVFTDAGRRAREPAPTMLRARRVILAAGTLGSTEILKRSASATLKFSRQLGRRCSTNGDALITHFRTDTEVAAAGREADAPDERRIGSTINGIIDLRDQADPQLRGLLVEEMASPASLTRLFGEIYATANAVHGLGECDRSRHEEGFPEDDAFELRDRDIENSGLYAMMGDDDAQGEIELTGEDADADGSARLRWPGLGDHPLFERQVKAFQRLAEGRGGRVLPNPLWRPLPEGVGLISQVGTGPLVTVHPLGGCPMADDVEDGVVDDLGRVFDGDGYGTHDGLVVLDGAIVPTALGANPALTIAALALRASEKLAADEWQYHERDADAAPDWTEFERPRFREIIHGFAPDPTTIRVTERMRGIMPLRNVDGEVRDWVVEFTIRSRDKSLRELARPSAGPSNGVIDIAAPDTDATIRSSLRIVDPEDYEEAVLTAGTPREVEQAISDVAAFETAITDGSLVVLDREACGKLRRVLRGAWAWLWNHGTRDIWQSFGQPGPRSGLFERIRSGIAVASHAGECRVMRYQLELADAVPSTIAASDGTEGRIVGRKRFTYGLCSNPWLQLSELELTRFPGLVQPRRSILSLDQAFLARVRIPLIEITGENDGVTALAELASFLAYLGRMVIGIHAWSFRAPDPPREIREPERLPGNLAGMAPPHVYDLYLGDERPLGPGPAGHGQGDPVPVHVRLTRYANADSDAPPIVMLHGYSASGTTFAHDAVDDNFVRRFHGLGRDVWVVDMRSSCGMPTARAPWSFEQMAFRDIPEAVGYVCEETGRPQVDIIAHCMGAAMLGMALLFDEDLHEGFANPGARAQLSHRIRRVVFTQVGPVMTFAPANVFRAYVAKFVRQWLPDNYEFDPGPNPGPGDRLLDRLLATVPYSKREFRLENPILPWKRTPWTQIRHRMDALYGRTFNVEHMEKQTLEHIRDFFGPLSIDTVSQTIHFARFHIITDIHGRNLWVARSALKEKLGDGLPLLMVSARQNGLMDFSTLRRMERVFKEDAGLPFHSAAIDDAGHQDCLIGAVPRQKTLAEIEGFLAPTQPDREPVAETPEPLVAYSPWIGPVLTQEVLQDAVGIRTIRIGTRPTHLRPEGVLLLRVWIEGTDILRDRDTSFLDTADASLSGLQATYVTKTTPVRGAGWYKLELPVAADSDEHNAWLVLVIYNEAEALNERHDGHYRLSNFDGRLATPLPLKIVPLSGELDPEVEAALGRMGKDKSMASSAEPDVPCLVDDGLALPVDFFKATMSAATRVLRAHAAAQRARGEHPAPVAADETDRPPIVLLRDGETADETAEEAADGLPPVAVAEAAVDRLQDENFQLMDGVIPDPEAAPSDECRFLLASCQYPASLLDSPLAYDSYRLTMERVSSAETEAPAAGIVPRFGIFAGDQVYADASAGLSDPSVRDGRFRIPYEDLLRFPYVRSVLRRIPSYMLLDDHELDDNWEPVAGDTKNVELGTVGVDAYRKYQRGLDETLPYEFKADDFDFFQLDIRSGRQQRNVSEVDRCRLWSDDADFDAFTQWLAGTTNGGDQRPRFVVTPSMLLPRHRQAAQWGSVAAALNSDGWDGYPLSLLTMLKTIVDAQARNLVFLSGDEHLASHARIEVRERASDESVVIHSVHTAAAFAPYPFANGSRYRHLVDETFYFSIVAGNGLSMASEQTSSPGSIDPDDYDYVCEVTTRYPAPADGMTYLRAYRDGGRWSMDCEFASETLRIADLSA
ncbi:MAG: alpha/beta fold hydrolase [Gammaproteobacteria bacterium]